MKTLGTVSLVFLILSSPPSAMIFYNSSRNQKPIDRSRSIETWNPRNWLNGVANLKCQSYHTKTRHAYHHLLFSSRSRNHVVRSPQFYPRRDTFNSGRHFSGFSICIMETANQICWPSTSNLDPMKLDMTYGSDETKRWSIYVESGETAFSTVVWQLDGRRWWYGGSGGCPVF